MILLVNFIEVVSAANVRRALIAADDDKESSVRVFTT